MAVVHPVANEVNNVDADRSTVETFGHFLARECQVILEVCIIISIIATVGMMVTFWFLAIIPATIGLLSYGLLMLANTVERKTNHQLVLVDGERVAADRIGTTEVIHDDQSLADATPSHVVESAVQRRLTRVSIECLVGAALLAIVLAGSVLSWKVVTLGVFILFCYIILVTAPFWLAWLEKDMQEEVAHQQELASGE